MTIIEVADFILSVILVVGAFLTVWGGLYVTMSFVINPIIDQIGKSRR